MKNVLILAGILALLVYLLRQVMNSAYETATGGDGLDSSEWPEVLGGIEGSTMADVFKWAESTTRTEGKPGDLNYRNNNPGNLMGNIAGAAGKDSRGFAIFQTFTAGMAALVNDLSAKIRKYPDYTLVQISARYLGGDPNNIPADGKVYVNGKYQGNVFDKANVWARDLGVSLTATLKEIFG